MISNSIEIEIKEGLVKRKEYAMSYKHYFPEQTQIQSVLVLICGGGHTMKVWESTPDGRKGLALLFARKGAEVIIMDWARGSSINYLDKKLCSLTQKENIALIRKVISKELDEKRKLAFLGWSMGGPQAFILSCDIFPKRTSALLGYGMTGPLNFFHPVPGRQLDRLDFGKPYILSERQINNICNSPLFPTEHRDEYISEYLVSFSPLMVAIQEKRLEVKDKWHILKIKNPLNIPPTLLISGTLDPKHMSGQDKTLVKQIKKFQRDVSIKYLKDFPHTGIICLGNEKIVEVYLDWLKKRRF